MQSQLAQDASPCVITTHGLTKKFDSLVAVRDLNLQVMRGDVFGFLGPNGSGKTTTIRMLLGLIHPTAGRVELFGMDNAAYLPLILPRIGAIIETPVFYPELSGIDNLRTIALASGMRLKASASRIDEILELVDLRGQAGDAYRKYSLGMKQRLGIGAALFTDPELILLDEPTNGLDPAGVHEVRQLILRLAATGKTIFISSHVLYEIQQVCNRVAILQKGRLIKQGNVRDLLQQNEHLIVRMDTPELAQRALVELRKRSEQSAQWIKSVSAEKDGQDGATLLHVEAPVTRSSEITALLAEQKLFVAELYRQQLNLEEVFLELTEANGADARRGMVALAGERS